MKKLVASMLCVLSGGLLVMADAQADDRIVVDTPNGQQSCLFVDNALVDCVPVEELRYLVDTPNGQMGCLWQDGAYVDCQPVPAEEVPEVSDVQPDPGVMDRAQAPVESEPQIEDQPGGQIDSVSEPMSEPQPEYQPVVVEQQPVSEAPASSSDSSFGWWDNDYDMPGGLVFGFSLGWFGHVYRGESTENGFSFGGNIGFKTVHFGFTMDIDLSVSPTDKKFHDLWTYSFSGMLMTHLPLTYGIEQTIGFGVGYTAWSLDYEYTTQSLHYNWYTGYYIKEEDHSKNIDNGGWLSLKLKTRMDCVADDFVLGLEFDWIPWIDTKTSKIVNNIIGLQLYIGGLVTFD